MSSGLSVRKLVSNKSFGIEIECFFERDRCPSTYSYVGFFFMTTDGSIRTDSYSQDDREMVSQPLPIKWLITEINRLEKKVGKWLTNESCGIHVHVNRSSISMEKAKAIFKFYQECTAEEQEEFFGRKSNGYCRAFGTIGSSRYMAVNTTNPNTIEFRMFASGNAAWACYCVKMVGYLIHNAKHLNVEAVQAFVDSNKPR